MSNKLLVLDTSYSFEDITKRGMLESVTCRDLNGYFEHVYTVHPFASIVTSLEWAKIYGSSDTYKINSVHTFIEGKIGRFELLKWIFPLNFLLGQISLFLELRRLIKKEKITIIRVGDMLYLGLFGLMLSRACKVPFVIRVGGNHDKIFESTGQPIQKRLFQTRKVEKKIEQFVFPRANLVAAANLDNLNFALANGAKKEFSTIFRYGNLLYKEHFTEPSERKEGQSLLKELDIDGKPFLICIGRLEPVKQPEAALYALANVRKDGYDACLIMVGDGTMRDILKQKVKELGVEENVIFAGNKSQDWLCRVIPLAAVVLSPLTGRALSEAALGNVPIVAYDLDWQGELIINEETGLLVSFPNTKAFGEAASRFFAEPEFAKKMARQLRDKAIDMLDHKKLDEIEIEAYEELKKRYYNLNKK